MKRLRDIVEGREKTPHELRIRQIATERREDFYGQHHDPNRLAKYGDCGHVSNHVCDGLKVYYRSARVVDGTYYHHHRTGEDRGELTGDSADHSWIEIPEIKHFVDPTHDQMPTYHKNRKTMIQSKSGLFPDNAIKIGRMNGRNYRKYYKPDR